METNVNTSPAIQPMPLSMALLFFGIPMLLFVFVQRVAAPYLDSFGVPPLANFFVLMSPHILFFFGALIAYRMEGNPFTWEAFSRRFRLNPIRGKTWGWVALATIGQIALYLLVYAAGRPILKVIYDALPDPEILNRVLGDSTTFVGYPLSGNFWLLGIYLTYYFFNILGEEFWWRGYIFPRQELVHGSRTWLVHGVLWAGFHLFSPYNALMVLPGALLVSWIAQKQQNNWIFLIAHAAINVLTMIRIISGILS